MDARRLEDKKEPQVPSEVGALLSALRFDDADMRSLQGLNDRDWEKLLNFSDLAHLTLSLAQVEWTGFPLWVMERLERSIVDNAARFDRVKSTYNEAANALREAGIDFLVFKGFAQSPRYVEDPRLRFQSDIDLYVLPEAVESARVALSACGYEAEATLDYSLADHLPTFVRPGNWRWRGNHFDPEMPLSIELHFSLWNEGVFRLAVPEVKEFWERRTSRTVEGITFPCLSVIDHLGHLTLHILRGIFAGDWIVHHVYELARFLHKHAEDDDFWNLWQQAHGRLLRAKEMIPIFLARAWFGCDVHEALESEFVELPGAIAKWLERFPNSPLETVFRQNKDYLWLQAAMLPTLRERGALVVSKLLPRRIPNKNHFAVGLKDRTVRTGSRFSRYISYLAWRSATHGRIIPSTLARGLGWWFAQL